MILIFLVQICLPCITTILLLPGTPSNLSCSLWCILIELSIKSSCVFLHALLNSSPCPPPGPADCAGSKPKRHRLPSTYHDQRWGSGAWKCKHYVPYMYYWNGGWGASSYSTMQTLLPQNGEVFSHLFFSKLWHFQFFSVLMNGWASTLHVPLVARVLFRVMRLQLQQVECRGVTLPQQ